MELSDRQRQIINFIRQHIESKGFSPSVRDIAKHCSLSSSGGIHKHLKILEKKGHIALTQNTSRSIRLLNEEPILEKAAASNSLTELPFKGMVAAGLPIEYQLEGETISCPSEIVAKPERSFVLKIRGNSMIEECIQDGDFIVVEERNIAANGEMVVAMINHQEATLKKFYHEGHVIRLQPANYEMAPIYVDPQDVSIHGIVVGVIRKY